MAARLIPSDQPAHEVTLDGYEARLPILGADVQVPQLHQQRPYRTSPHGQAALVEQRFAVFGPRLHRP